jgi:hypothetical protein
MSDTSKLVAAILAAAKVSQSPGATVEAYIAEYESFCKALGEREAAATTGFIDHLKNEAERNRN